MKPQATVFARMTTITSREFNQHTGEAKLAADKAPVLVTDRGQPAYVLMSSREYERMAGNAPFVSAAEAFADPNYSPDDFDLMDFIPKRQVDPVRFSFDDDE